MGGRFTIFCFVLLCIRGQIPITSPRGAYIRRGDLTRVFCVKILGGLYLEGLIQGGAYFRNFTVLLCQRLKFWRLIVIPETLVTSEVGFIAQLIEKAGLQRG